MESFDFEFHSFLIIHFCEWCGFEVILVGWRTSMKIHEISGWNKIYPRNTIYNFVSSMNCTSHMWIQIVELDWHVLNLPNTTLLIFPPKEYVKVHLNYCWRQWHPNISLLATMISWMNFHPSLIENPWLVFYACSSMDLTKF